MEAIAIIKARNVSRLTALRRKCDGDTLLMGRFILDVDLPQIILEY